MRRIGLLGGTFDPPHMAHVMIAQEALIGCGLDEVWFIPTYIPPHKTRENMASTNDRADMVASAVEDNEHFFFSDVELKREGASYTIDTVRSLMNDIETPAELYFIVGGDMADTLDTWRNIEELRRLVTFIVLDRPTYYASPPFQEGVIHLKAPRFDISSSVLRERIQNNQNIRYLVPERVRNLIEARRLYE
ncbi:nicotinate-nucleotide adenylyltransferase [Salsuginibacillus halophilus]|uniref:Probable nicotinate-nucleotide adenylyltransferase n=1 Tax=Salsuginibacillus halophilus TaxID=517424 RepID=A0A2P8HFS2_9BACI|nr:nicotinate-nucleotide adenylyltransferase [Salsuginibacillus halophilus]PSL45055.1 nicotinate-nucleotide adenylyltransferase [Salsuginibacillus halophilus]